jgi:hypothetical protein
MNKNKSSAWGQRFESLVEDFMERGYSKAKDSVDQVVDKAEGLVDSAVDQVQSKIVRPVTIFSRAVAFSIILVVLGLFSLIFLTIGLFRFVDTYLFASHQWLSYLLIGAWFILWGLFILRFRQSRKNRRS